MNYRPNQPTVLTSGQPIPEDLMRSDQAPMLGDWQKFANMSLSDQVAKVRGITSSAKATAGRFNTLPSNPFVVSSDPYAQAGPNYGQSGREAPAAFSEQDRPSGSTGLQQQLPSAPPSKSGTKRPSIWDKEHISETLAGIGQSFLSNQNFGEGLGAAAGVIGGRQGDLRREGQKAITYGGPGGQFEIATDAAGNREIRQVPEFAAAVEAERAARSAPNATVSADLRARALYNIQKLPVEQRAAAYNELRTNPQAYGIDATGMPEAWSDTYGQVAGGMGMNVNQAENQVRNGILADNRIATNVARTDQGERRVAQGEARLGLSREAAGRAASKGSTPRGAPPSARKGYSTPRSREEYNALPKGSKYIAPDGSARIK